MRLIIDEAKPPFDDSVKWLYGKDIKVILASNQDEQFKDELKQTVLNVTNVAINLFKEKLPVWSYYKPHAETFGTLLTSVFRLALSKSIEYQLSIANRIQLLTFINFTFNSVEVDYVLEQIKKYLSLTIWFNLPKKRRDKELSPYKTLTKAWLKLEKQNAKFNEQILLSKEFERTALYRYIMQFLNVLLGIEAPICNESIPEEFQQKSLFCLRFLEFIIDLESQLPLKRFLHLLLDFNHFLIRCRLSTLFKSNTSEGYLFAQLVELLSLYYSYQIDIMTGETLSMVESLKRHEGQVQHMQRILWKHFESIKEYALASVKSIDNPDTLNKIMSDLPNNEARFNLLHATEVAHEDSLDEKDREDQALLTKIFVDFYKRQVPQHVTMNSIPLFPSEKVIWDINLVPDEYYNYEYPLAVPKLNMQFLSMDDYFLRNFILFKNETTYELRQDIEDGIIRSKCKWNAEGCFTTGPKQRMALILKDFSLLEIGKPRIGESKPSKVTAKVVINMDYVRPQWRAEWEQLRKHDICFLITFEKLKSEPTTTSLFPFKHGIKYVRGCEIEALLDSHGKPIDEYTDDATFENNLRTYIVNLDADQFKIDQDYFDTMNENVYEKFHLIVRRKPEQNNFKGVLGTIRSLINTKSVVPEWIKDIILGYGNPSDAHFSMMRKNDDGEQFIEYFDTFLDYSHLFASFKPYVDRGYLIDRVPEQSSPPYKVRFDEEHKKIIVLPYVLAPKICPKTPRKNTVPFTPSQVEAITSGLQDGLTLIVGPPGSGKTDVAVQILSCLYHANPDQRTLIVTHSNQALNQIFDKIVELDVEEHHLLRLGYGEKELQTTKDFSVKGRVEYVINNLRPYKPFEVLSNNHLRSQYLLTKEARIIAMTCTHAGLKRKELVDLGFQYDNILMEETAQILEIETSISLLLQNTQNGVNRLKRWIMIGDHNQLPPIIQNTAFQKYSNMEQSLFARFIRLGVPVINLDAQGRSRPSICDLYRWRYPVLDDLPIVFRNVEYSVANAGFQYEYQMINVPDYLEVGEETPSPHYFINKGEAEFVVALYKYMRKIGYPNEKITILTTYNGQKQLIKDLVDRDCENNNSIGLPSKITTVDKFQGQQNDYILLSLVRTKSVGHVRDVRRLVVAMSRARLGLYVVGRVGLFARCFELRHPLKLFMQRPLELRLVRDEQYKTTTRLFTQVNVGDKLRLVHGLEDLISIIKEN